MAARPRAARFPCWFRARNRFVLLMAGVGLLATSGIVFFWSSKLFASAGLECDLRAPDSQLSRLAVLTLTHRAIAHQHQTSAFHDSWALAAVRALCPNWKNQHTAAESGIMAVTIERAREFDRQLSAILKDSPARVVVLNLGAGMCTRYWRMGLDRDLRVRWVDVDTPSVLQAKQSIVPAASERYSMYNGDVAIGQADLAELLEVLLGPEEARPWNPCTVVLIAEGVLFYYPEHAISRTVDSLLRSSIGCRTHLVADMPPEPARLLRAPVAVPNPDLNPDPIRTLPQTLTSSDF
eukprot:TRINITY_DN3210_c0_g1_i3.p1 TRINITY_DN3210_c0_g1~~TRINITY_DN3210_c0_g1_i3.p1  ORF type:complete len:294 (+),score=28.65 TRINITY_DN3210_c0_g1_i3:232-1113(+)